ncbi:tRNA pseudouridine synthase A [Candidatus Desulfarcum epimagneticum]|uniref:tRNA pseudouridine synthase A n=1 Tax=uncultured Desulfobacteraceae bacterium TaxID=218296 RepID=A0A484HDW5_9BACT|nr:tRNA pseudouridine synthase A [uncultured Desulfobacteraceae bacterium]
MKKNFKLVIEYDGTAYHGWQRQKDAVTVQETIERAVFSVTREKVSLLGSGRTDAGVHARGQTANFLCETRLSAHVMKRALNSLLPDDIVICDCETAPESFHARYDAKSKIYRYFFLNTPHPSAIRRRHVWHIPQKLDVEAMSDAARRVAGRHDFKAFEGHGRPDTDARRHVMAAALFEKKGGRLVFEIEADGFLRHMVRNIVGTLVEAGLGRMDPGEIGEIFRSRDRGRAGPTAPARGLFLWEVKY